MFDRSDSHSKPDPAPARILANSCGAAGVDSQGPDSSGVARRRAILQPAVRPRAAAIVADTQWLTPPEVAALLRIRLEKVLGWIHDGRLLAVNVASDGAVRPRWRVSRTALDAFLTSRSNRAGQSVAPIARRSRRPADDVVEFFK